MVRGALTSIVVGLLAAAPILLPSAVDVSDLDDADAVELLVHVLPYMLFVLAGLLGFRLNQTRVLIASIIWISSYWFLFADAIPFMNRVPSPERARMIALHLPAAMIVLFGRGEWPLVSLRGAGRALLAMTPLLVMLIIWKLEPGWLRTLLRWSALGDGLRKWRLPDVGLALAVVFATIIPLTRDQRMRAFVYAVAATLVPIGYGLNALVGARRAAASLAAARFSLSLGFCSAAFILLYMLYRIYWERVYLDDLTQILNRRALDEKLNVLRKRYAIAMVDIDHFKKFNDTYGHDQGDHVLRLVAHQLRRAFGHRAYRYGGEEFCIVLEGTDPGALKSRLDDVRETLAEKEFYLRAPRPKRDRAGRKKRGKGGSAEKRVNVTASFGVALSDGGASAKEVINAADEALYTAKRRGRNRVVVAEPRS